MSKIYPYFLVFVQFNSMAIMPILAKNFIHSLISVFIFLIGVAIGLKAIKDNGRDNFNITPTLKEACILRTDGLYAYVRHPMYLSVFLMALSFFISTPTFIEFLLLIILTTALFLKAKEEEKLWCNHNREYLKYKKRVKAIIPFIL